MKSKLFKSLKCFVAFYLIITVILPLLTVLTHISSQDIMTVISSSQFMPMLLNSLTTTICATFMAVSIAYVLAWCINRSNIRYKSILVVLFTVPMLVPSVSHGMGLTLMFGDNGLLTNFLGINIHLYGFTGIVIGAVLYSFPVAFLMLNDVFQYEDYTIYESSQVLGLSKIQQFKKITVPNFKKPMISVIFAVFTMVFTDYGVPLVVGGKMMTLPVYMYREVIGLLDYSKGAIIGVILLIPAAIAFFIDLRNKDVSNGSTIVKSYIILENRKRDLVSYVICGVVLVLISLPILVFILLSFVSKYPIDMSFTIRNIIEAFDLGIGMYLLNSLFIALTTALLGMFVSYFTAYLTARSKKSFSSVMLHLISMISLSIPGIVLGLSYVLFFKGSMVYGTLILLIMVNMTHFFASPYFLAYNSLNKFNENLEDISTTIGISRIRLMIDVYMPSTRGTMIEMFSYIFVNAMVTISAISFLADFRTMPLALLIPQFDSQSLIEATAFISIIILTVNVTAKLLVYLIKRKFTNASEV